VIEPARVVVADPAWLFGDALPGETRGASRVYDCMRTYAICSLTPDCGHTIMGQPIADDAILFLWRVAALQQDALVVARAWNFEVKTDLVWLKKTTDGLRWFGMGRTLRAEHEICLVCTRGRPSLKSHSIRSTFVTDLDVAGLSARVGRHSEKPDEFYEIVDSLSDGPYLELFARKTRAGWRSVGNELPEQPPINQIGRLLDAPDEELGAACSLLTVPETIAMDEEFRESYVQGYRHAIDDVRSYLKGTK